MKIDEHMKKAFDLAPCGMGIYQAGNINAVYLNDNFFQINGYTREEFKDIAENNINALVYPDDIILPKEYLNLLRNEGEIVRKKFRIIHKSGEIRWIEMNASLTTLDGEMVAIASFMDITEQKELEIENVLEEELCHLIVNELEAAYFEWNLKTGEFFTSKSGKRYAICQMELSNFIQKKRSDVVYSDDWQEINKLNQAYETGKDRAEGRGTIKTHKWGISLVQTTGILQKRQQWISVSYHRYYY